MSSPVSESGSLGEYASIFHRTDELFAGSSPPHSYPPSPQHTPALSSRQTGSPTQASSAPGNAPVLASKTSPEYAKRFYHLAFVDGEHSPSPPLQPSPHRGRTRQLMAPSAGSQNPLSPPPSPRGLSSRPPHMAPSAGSQNPLSPPPSRGLSSTPPHMSPSRAADNAPAQAPPAASTRPGTPQTSSPSLGSDITPPHRKPPSSRPWYRTTRCKIIAVALLVTVLAFTAWGSYELHEYLSRPSKSAVVTQRKPDDESNGTKPMPNKPSIFTMLTHTKAEITHTEARIPHTEAGITHTEAEITHTEAIFPHTVPSQDCQETGCDSNQQCLATGECVCADGFTGYDCKPVAREDIKILRIVAIVIISLLAGIILGINGILYKRSKSAHVQRV